MKNNILILSLVFLLLNNIAIADEGSLQEQINAQQNIINDQSKRIDELEILIKNLQKGVSEDNINVIDNAEVLKKQDNDASVIEEGDMVAAKGKIYNPETAFFGPLPQLRSPDGKYSLGLMGLIQLDGAIYNQEPNYNTNNDFDVIFSLINAANFLNIKSLLDLLCAYIASKIKSKIAIQRNT